jgi:hypothetical protein
MIRSNLSGSTSPSQASQQTLIQAATTYSKRSWGARLRDCWEYNASRSAGGEMAWKAADNAVIYPLLLLLQQYRIFAFCSLFRSGQCGKYKCPANTACFLPHLGCIHRHHLQFGYVDFHVCQWKCFSAGNNQLSSEHTAKGDSCLPFSKIDYMLCRDADKSTICSYHGQSFAFAPASCRRSSGNHGTRSSRDTSLNIWTSL